MNIAIIGSGHVGSALARGLVRAGHSVRISARHIEHAEAAARDTGAIAVATNREALQGADLAILAVPASAHAEVAEEIEDLTAGLTIIDVSNPVNREMSALTTTRSAAQDLQDRLPRANVVKAFNTVFAVHQAEPVLEGEPLDGFFAGDDEGAKAKVAEILKQLGYRPIDAGSLEMARTLEEMEFLNIRLNVEHGWPWQTEWRLVGPRS